MSTQAKRPSGLGTQPTPTGKGHTRSEVEKYLENQSGKYSKHDIAAVLGLDVTLVTYALQTMRKNQTAVSSTGPGVSNALWQHHSHVTRERAIKAGHRITNSNQPNGSRAYWQAHQAAFMASDRHININTNEQKESL